MRYKGEIPLRLCLCGCVYRYSGDRTTALQKPNSTVLTLSTAHKLFGDEDPMGKTVTHYESDTDQSLFGPRAE